MNYEQVSLVFIFEYWVVIDRYGYVHVSEIYDGQRATSEFPISLGKYLFIYVSLLLNLIQYQITEPLKLDWYTLLEKDFIFLGISMDEEKISRTPKEVYKTEILKQIKKSAFTYFLNL